VTVTLDETDDDGEAGEHDAVAVSTENVTGGAGDDVLTGSSAGNALSGGPGNDRLGGADGDDRLDGGPGADQLDGGPGTDAFAGGDGDDTLAARDGTAEPGIACGAGTDSVAADAADVAAADCEAVDRPAPVVPAGSEDRSPGPATLIPASALMSGPAIATAEPATDIAPPRLSFSHARVDGHRRLRIAVHCPATEVTCTIRVSVVLSLGGRRVTLRGRSVRLAKDQTIDLTFRAPAALLSKIRSTRTKRLSIQLRGSARDAVGNATRLSARVRLRLVRRAR
jgi:Ca2+-binding RTX toxin-like protein